MGERGRFGWLSECFSRRSGEAKQRDELALVIIPELVGLVEANGVDVYDPSEELPLKSRPIRHRNLIFLGGDERKRRYVASLTFYNGKTFLQIADYGIERGEERAMLFEGTSFKISQICSKLRHLRSLNCKQITLSEREQLSFLEEITKARVDQEATQMLSGYTS